MRILTVFLVGRKVIFALLILILACDSFTEEILDPGKQIKFSQTEFYILPGGSTVIDFSAVIKQSLTSTSLGIPEKTPKGTLTKLTGSTYKYTSNVNFVGGSDKIDVAYYADATTISSQALTVFMKNSDLDFPCGVYPVEDKVVIDSSARKAVHVLKNDRICGVDGEMSVIIQIPPKFGSAFVEGDSIIYTPGPDFSGNDELVYRLSTADDEEVFVGLVSYSKRPDPILEPHDPSLGIYEIFFVDDEVGYAVTGGGVFIKTIDGGANWVTAGEGLNSEYGIGELFFLNEHTGFATLSKCEWWDAFCTGGLAMTTDGGKTWKITYSDYLVTSIHFVSAQTGFMSVSANDTDHDDLRELSIYKTVNGGESWDDVFSAQSYNATLKIRFANDLVGYAYDQTVIYRTSDGGQSWQTTSLTGKIVSSFAIIDDKFSCASFSSIGDYPSNTPSAIVLSENGSAWNPVRNLPYTILAQGFSPDGSLGLAIGITGYDPTGLVYPVTISVTEDRGKTWTDFKKNLNCYPSEICVTSNEAAVILCSGQIIKYTP